MMFKKYLHTKEAARCCGFPMHRSPKYVLLREPPVAFRLLGHTCQVCKRIGVTEEDITSNVHRALLAAKRVHPPADMWRLMQKEQRDTKSE